VAAENPKHAAIKEALTLAEDFKLRSVSWLPAARYPLPVARYPLPATRCPLHAARSRLHAIFRPARRRQHIRRRSISAEL